MTTDRIEGGADDSVAAVAAKGAAWSAIARLGSQGLLFVTAIVLARLLAPDAFGLAGMAAFFFGIAAALSELGIAAAVVAFPNPTRRHLSTAFWMNAGAGLVLWIVFAACGPLLAVFFEEPRLATFAAAMGLPFLLNVGAVQQGLLQRDLKLKQLAVAEIGAALVGSAAAIIAAVAGAGYWSLAVGPAVTMAVLSVAVTVQARWLPEPRFSRSAFRDLLGFVSGVTGGAIVSHVSRNIDNLIVGKMLGTTALGVYSRGFNVVLIPLWQVTQVLGRVVFPLLSRFRDDLARSRDVYVRSLGVVALLAFPACAAIGASADVLVPVLLGDQWDALIPVLRVLVLVGLARVVLGTTVWIYQARRRVGIQFWLLVVMAVAVSTGAVIGAQQDLVAVAAGVAVATFVVGTVNVCVAVRLIGLGPGRMVGALVPPLLVSVLVAAVMFGAGRLMPEAADPVVLLVECLIGGVVFLVAARIMAARHLREVVTMLRLALGRSTA